MTLCHTEHVAIKKASCIFYLYKKEDKIISIRPIYIAIVMIAPLYASAQSNVEMYGYLDLGIVKETGDAPKMERGYNNWLGFRGKENLGNGLEVIFNIETRFKLDTGETERPANFWQGESTVGLTSKDYGTLRLGRALTPLWNTVWKYEPWINSGFNASLASYQTGSYSSDGVHDIELGYADFSRISDGVFYSSPTWNGIAIQTAMKIDDDAAASSRARGTSISYSKDALSVAASYEVNARNDDILYLAAKYAMGNATIMGSHAQNRQIGLAQERTWLVAATYAIGADMIRAGYGRNQKNDNHKISTGYVHSLSKRTTLYADLYREQLANAKTGVALGITHTF